MGALLERPDWNWILVGHFTAEWLRRRSSGHAAGHAFLFRRKSVLDPMNEGLRQRLGVYPVAELGSMNKVWRRRKQAAHLSSIIRRSLHEPI
jgi:hypothetical protein